MTLDPIDIERALDQVGQSISDQPDYADFLRHRARYASDALTLSPVLDESTLLEVGSFPGHFTALMSVLNVPCVGIDIDPRRLKSLSQCFQLNIKRCDIERQPLPFDDASLKQIVFSEVFEHLRIDPFYALSELNRVLVPGGFLLVTTPNLYAVQKCFYFLIGRGFGDPLEEFKKLRTLGHMGHVREYSHYEMRRFLEAGGFQMERVWFKHYYYGGGKRGLAKRLIFTVVPARLRTFQVMLVRKAHECPRLSPLV